MEAHVERKASPPDRFLRKPGCEAFSSANPKPGWSSPLPAGQPPGERNRAFQSAPAVLDDWPRTRGGTRAGSAMQSEAEAYTAGVAARDADGTRPTRSRRAVPESDGLAASRRVPSARTPSHGRGMSQSWHACRERAPSSSSSSSLAPPPPRSARTPAPRPGASSRASSRANPKPGRSSPLSARYLSESRDIPTRRAPRSRLQRRPSARRWSGTSPAHRQ